MCVLKLHTVRVYVCVLRAMQNALQTLNIVEFSFLLFWFSEFLLMHYCSSENSFLGYFLQVETVGDKYMTVSGLPEPCTHHAKSICHLALDMMEIAGQVKVDEEPVQVHEMFI